MPYLHLASERDWPRFALSGLAVSPDGHLALAPVPRVTDAVSPVIEGIPGLEGPVGVAVAPDGSVYYSDPLRHRVMRIVSCADASEPIPCLRGPGVGIGEVDRPRGVTIDTRNRLWVADSGNRRVQAWNLETGAVSAVRSYSTGPLNPFKEPWDVASDDHGNLYVADPGEALPGGLRRGGGIYRFDAYGHPDLDFVERLHRSLPALGQPSSVAVVLAQVGGNWVERLLVLDRQPAAVIALRMDGSHDPVESTRWNEIASQVLSAAQSIDAQAGRVFIGTPDQGALSFDGSGAFLGRASDVGSEAAGVAFDCEGRIVVHPGSGGALQRSGTDTAFSASGTLIAGPFEGMRPETEWQRIVVDLVGARDRSHLRLFTLTSDTLDGVGPVTTPAIPDISSAGPEIDSGDGIHYWRVAPPDSTALYLQNPPGRYLWIAGILTGDRTQSPTIKQIRVDFDREGWTANLPALYRRDPQSRAATNRLLGVFETLHDDGRLAIDELPARFDPHATPDDPGSAGWLDWLASWVGVDLGEGWPEQRRRTFVSEAFRLQARRGTVDYLAHMIQLHSGVQARIVEGATSSDVWALGKSRLGSETRPISAPPQGSVLDLTATVDTSYLTRSDELGAELFDETVHCLFVHLYRGDISEAGAVQRVREVLDRQVPAHMVYRLCVIEPQMAVGSQSRVGVDAIVGGSQQRARPGEPFELGKTSVLHTSASSPAGNTAVFTVGESVS